MDNLVYDSTSRKLANAINMSAVKQSIYAHNIANSSTPGFKPLSDDFASILKQEEFNLEEEMAKMNKNRLEHNSYLKILKARTDIAKKVFTLGKGG